MHTPVLDAHVHQWDQRGTPRETSGFVRLLGWHPPAMNWLARRVFPTPAVRFFGSPEPILADYLPDDLLVDAGEREVRGFVHVEAGWKGPDPVDETRWLESLQTPLLRGIVGHADLSNDRVEDVLTAHLAASPRFRGVRHTLSHHPDKAVLSGCERGDLMQDPRWQQGYARLEALDLSFEATVYHHQLAALAELAEQHPGVPMVICHAGTPVAYGGEFAGHGKSESERATIAEDWRSGMRRFVDFDHVSVKVSGLLMPIVGWGFHERPIAPTAAELAEALREPITFLVDTFGADRCMFGSNFPVEKVSTSWHALVEAIDLIVAQRSEADRAALFHDTAERVYRLK